jgi:hypothetical protein
MPAGLGLGPWLCTPQVGELNASLTETFDSIGEFQDQNTARVPSSTVRLVCRGRCHRVERTSASRILHSSATLRALEPASYRLSCCVHRAQVMALVKSFMPNDYRLSLVQYNQQRSARPPALPVAWQQRHQPGPSVCPAPARAKVRLGRPQLRCGCPCAHTTPTCLRLEPLCKCMEASVIRPLPVPALARGEDKMKAELDALKARGATIEEKYDMLWRNQVLPPARPRLRTHAPTHECPPACQFVIPLRT